MPLDFPASPTNGQVYEQYVYDSSLPGWRSKGGAVAATYTSDTAPSGAVKGDMWYRTSDGTTYVYVVDANTSQWVEIRSEISTAQVGLVPVKPSSVAVGSGSASVAADGVVTFTGTTSISLNGVFTSTYRHYKFIAKYHGSASAVVSYRLRASGSDVSIVAYYSSGWYARATNGGNGYWTANASGLLDVGRTDPTPDQRSFTMMEVLDPQAAKATAHSYQWGGQDAGGLLGGFSNGGYLQTLQFDGFTLFINSGNMTGTIEVYGYN